MTVFWISISTPFFKKFAIISLQLVFIEIQLIYNVLVSAIEQTE